MTNISREIANTFNILTSILKTPSNSTEYKRLKLLLNDDEKIALKLLKSDLAQSSYKQNKINGTTRPKYKTLEIVTSVLDLTTSDYMMIKDLITTQDVHDIVIDKPNENNLVV